MWPASWSSLASQTLSRCICMTVWRWVVIRIRIKIGGHHLSLTRSLDRLCIEVSGVGWWVQDAACPFHLISPLQYLNIRTRSQWVLTRTRDKVTKCNRCPRRESVRGEGKWIFNWNAYQPVIKFNKKHITHTGRVFYEEMSDDDLALCPSVDWWLDRSRDYRAC